MERVPEIRVLLVQSAQDGLAILGVDHVVSFTNLVRCFPLVPHHTEKKEFQTLRKNSSAIPASWMVSGHCGMILGQGGVVW